MEWQNFKCPIDGQAWKNQAFVEIKIPTECHCGSKIEIDFDSNNSFSVLKKIPCEHIITYKDIWNLYGPNGSEKYLEPITEIKYGFNCIKCNERNNQAEANQPDGTFKCYSCRNPW